MVKSKFRADSKKKKKKKYIYIYIYILYKRIMDNCKKVNVDINDNFHF